MATADLKLQALLELERRGALNPQATQLLAAYRAQGVTKTKPLNAQGRPLPTSDVMETPKARDTARANLDLISRIEPQLSRVEQLYKQNLKGVGPIKSFREYLPSQSNAAFDNAVNMLTTLVRPATRTPGEGGMSDFESKLAVAPLPGRYKMDGGNEESLKGLRSLIDSVRSDSTRRIGLPTPPPIKQNAGWTIQEH